MTRYRVIWHEPEENFLNIDYVKHPEVGDEYRYRMPVWPGGVTVVKKVARPAGNEGRTCFAYIEAPSLADIEAALKHKGLRFRAAEMRPND
jgi:hypothetical protein